MAQTAQDILKQALQLPPADRLTVAQGLWDSVEPQPGDCIESDEELMAELKRRDAEMDAGTSLTREEMTAILQRERACKSPSTRESLAK